MDTYKHLKLILQQFLGKYRISLKAKSLQIKKEKMDYNQKDEMDYKTVQEKWQ